MKIIYNKIFPIGKRYFAINLFGFLFAKGPCNTIIINHEKIHTRQMQEMGFLVFYIIYIFEWLWKLILYRNSYKAYENISFEREAYHNQNNLNYLSNRKFYSWLKYLRK